MKTIDLEKSLFTTIRKMGTYICFEVAMPTKYRCGNVVERVDCLSYDTTGIWRFYELKLTKSDFKSKCKHTFLGHFNYYVMPYELYLQLKDEIPKEIGVYAVGKQLNCWCEKKAKRQELKVDEEKLKFNFMQALSRENTKRMCKEWFFNKEE